METLAGCNFQVDAIITDPPYGIRYKSNLQRGNRRNGNTVQVRSDDYFKEILNDGHIFTEWLPNAYRLLKDGGAVYIFLHWKTWSAYEKAVRQAGFHIKNMIVINKSNHGMGDLQGDYAPKHELVMFATKGRHILRFDEGRRKNVMDLPVKYSGTRRYHPNEKPMSWVEPFILESTEKDDVILDCFMGSGSTGAAAIAHSRSFIGIELDPQYYQAAVERINQLIPALFRGNYVLALPADF